MDGSISVSPGTTEQRPQPKSLDLLGRLESAPFGVNGMLVAGWVLTRGLLVLGMILGSHYCDPQFYNYAGKFAYGFWPYRDFPVEYPPLTIILLLLPAAVLTPFTGIAPRPDAIFSTVLTGIPQLDSVRYAAYGQAFAVEMLIIDAVTLWLVKRIVVRLGGSARAQLGAGLLYLAAVFASGALLQKFDLVIGTLCAGAVLALLEKRIRTAFVLVGLATLVKGYPILVAPILAVPLLDWAHPDGLRGTIRDGWRKVASAAAWVCIPVLIATVVVLLFAGFNAIVHTVTYHSGRGTELESIFANAQLLLGWLPGMHLATRFNQGDLSRIVVSSIDGVMELVSLVVTSLLVLVIYALYLRAQVRLSRADGSANVSANDQTSARHMAMIAAVAGVLLAFIIGFRALPAHYLLVLLPLIAVVKLPSQRLKALLLLAVLGVAVVGQVLASQDVWNALKAFVPWAVALLTLRNFFFVAVFGVLSAGLWRWGGMSAVVEVRPEEKKRGPGTFGSLVRSPRRTITAGWKRILRASPPIPGFNPRAEDVFAHLLANVSPARILIGAGVVSLLIYVGFVLRFPITYWWSQPHAADDPNVINDLGRITDHSPVAAALFVLAILVLFACQFFALVAAGRVIQERKGGTPTDIWVRRAVLAFPLLFVLVMIWMQPVTTTDLYGYVARGYLFAQQHQNPMILKASRLPGGLSVDRPEAPYGPLWLLITGGVSLVTGENLLLNMLAYKVIAALSALAAFFLVDWLAVRLFPDRRLRLLVLFTWSPLLIFETIGNGHNDILMMVCVLAAFALMLRGRARSAFAMLTLGALIKYVSAAFVPLWLVYELQHRMRHKDMVGAKQPEAAVATSGVAGWNLRARMHAMVRSLDRLDRREAAGLLGSVFVIGVVLTVVCYAPFWAGLHTFSGLGTQLRPLYYNGSIVAFITAPLKLLVSSDQWEPLDKTVRLVFYTLFAGYTFLQVRRLWLLGPLGDMRDVILAAAKITFAALILITFWFQPWYVIWLLPLVALSNDTFVRRQGIILSFGALLTYAVSNFLSVGESDISRDLFVQFFMIVVAFGPLLILRTTPYDQGLLGVARRYLASLGRLVSFNSTRWERIMIVLAMIVGALLRLLGLGNLTTNLNSSTGVSALKEVSGDLRLALSDPQGLNGPFDMLQKALVSVFGATPVAVLLPSAIIGTVTVLVIYLMTVEIMRQGPWRGARVVGVIAALLAATSRWHVSLSRSGMEIVLLPLLVCTALYCLLLAFRIGTHEEAALAMHISSESDAPSNGVAADDTSPPIASAPMLWGLDRRGLLLYVACGLCTGVACDLVPGLWLLPILVIGFLLVWRLRRPESVARLPIKIGVLALASLLSGIPTVVFFLSRRVGLPAGSAVFARSSTPTPPGPGLFTLDFWGQVLRNAGDVLGLLVSQDYTSGYPAVGTSPIIPFVLTPVFIVGVLIIVVRWRNMTATALLLLIALPLVASVAVGTPSAVIEAASVLPATCIVPALALYEMAVLLGHLPIVLDRMTGARVFSNPEQIGRLLLLVFLVVSTLRTFFWYFEASLPAQAPGTQLPSYSGPPPTADGGARSDAHVVYVLWPGIALKREGAS